LFGVTEEGCLGAISLPSGKTTIFVPRHSSEYEVWCGKPPELKEFEVHYGVDVRFVDEISTWLSEQGLALNPSSESKIYLNYGLNSDSGNYALPASFLGIEKFQTDTGTLFPVLAEARVKKNTLEIELMRYVNYVSSMAHVEVMRAAKTGMMEYQLESLFLHHTYTHGGCRHMAYTCICACGPNPAVLHYG
jgi:Xaa-Pro dipeptidase